VADHADFQNCKIDFKKEYTDTDTRIAKILQNLLEFNFHFRKPASVLLKSSLFDCVRKPELEEPCPTLCQLDFDS